MLEALAMAEPDTLRLYDELCRAVSKVGAFSVDPKKTSIHFVRKTAFLGVQARKNYLRITIKASRPFESDRIARSEQTSKSRWHHELKLQSKKEIDREFLSWVAEAFEVSS